MAREIRILQIGDLFIKDEQSAKLILDSLKEFRQAGRVDYITVCGNLTRSGVEFDVASGFLQRLQKHFFAWASNGGADGYRYNRLFLVPGERDAPPDGMGGRNFGPFLTFYNAFHSAAPPPMEPFDPEKPLVRCLIDLSLIGICHFSDPPDTRKGVQAAFKMLRLAAEMLSDRRQYAEETPTILVSSYPALLFNDGAVRVQEKADLVTGDPRQDPEVRLDLHLVNRPVTCITPEPYQCEHYTIGLGPRWPEQEWSGRVNLIRIWRRDWGTEPEPKKLVRRTLTVDAYNANRGWDTPAVPVQGLPFPDSDTDRGDGFVYDEIFAELADLLKHGHVLIRVAGLPGAGKDEMFIQLKSETDRPIFPYAGPLYCEMLSSYSMWEKRFEDLIEKLSKQKGQKPIIVFNETSGMTGKKNQSERLAKMHEEMSARADTDDCRIIYFLHHMSNPPDLPGLFPLPPLSVQTMERLLQRYSTRLPIASMHINSLTGGYAGFTLKLLQAVKKIVEEPWNGPRPVDSRASWELILEAMGSADLRKLTEQFFTVVMDDPGGAEIAQHLVAQMQEILVSSDPAKRISEPWVMTVADVAAETPGMQCTEADLKGAAEMLAEANVFRRENGRFIVREKIPFLVRARTVRPKGPPVFLSYSHRDSVRASQIVSALTAEGFSIEWDQALRAGDRITIEIANMLKKAACVVVLWSANSMESSWVPAEALRYICKTVCAQIDGGMTLEPPFNDIHTPDLSDWHGDRAGKQWKVLVSGIREKLRLAQSQSAS